MKAIFSRLWRMFCLMLANQPSLTLYLFPLLQWLWPGFIPQQYRANLNALQWQTADMLKLTLKVSQRWPGFIPGQHLVLSLQHNGRNLSRPFSICSPLSLWQSQCTIALCCKVHKDGQVTSLLHQLQNGAVLSISKAQGNFHWQKPTDSSVFIAAGSGITPIASMLLSQRHWLAPVSLFYRCRGYENAALLQELEQLAAKQPLFSIQLSDSRTEHADCFVQRLCAMSDRKQFYLCGPAGFMQQINAALISGGINQAYIQQEQFGLPIPTRIGHATETTQLAAHFVRAGSTTTVKLNNQLSLLQNAEQHGLTPRFGCRLGVCFQCVCDKVSGQVRDIRSGALSGHGAEQIQLCVSQSVTDLVIKL